MAEWDKFVIKESEKAVINKDEREYDIISLPSGRYFMSKFFYTDKKVISRLHKCTSKELEEKLVFPIYALVGYVADGKSGITTRIKDPKKICSILREIEDKLLD
jgi:uncharacterized protein (UPF0297 family)